ncbi:MAG TPA: hypothetical protein DIT04_11135 [Dysgonomonas sp.]|nr:hypothetical protein [Dysgonomonas sp.]
MHQRTNNNTSKNKENNSYSHTAYENIREYMNNSELKFLSSESDRLTTCLMLILRRNKYLQGLVGSYIRQTDDPEWTDKLNSISESLEVLNFLNHSAVSELYLFIDLYAARMDTLWHSNNITELEKLKKSIK